MTLRAVLRDVTAYWLVNTHAPYTRIEYQVNKAGHCLLIGLVLTAVCQLVHLHPNPAWLTLAVVAVYSTADYWAPFADHVHTSPRPAMHLLAKFAIALLAPILLLSLAHPWVLVVWFCWYLPVLIFEL